MAGGSLRMIRDDELYFSAIDIPCLIQVGFEVALQRRGLSEPASQNDFLDAFHLTCSQR
jgi:hypothetical protein